CPTHTYGPGRGHFGCALSTRHPPRRQFRRRKIPPSWRRSCARTQNRPPPGSGSVCGPYEAIKENCPYSLLQRRRSRACLIRFSQSDRLLSVRLQSSFPTPENKILVVADITTQTSTVRATRWGLHWIVSVLASMSRGTTRVAYPLSIAALGMPYTTHESSLCATVSAPADFNNPMP